jgi:hypothetical protein
VFSDNILNVCYYYLSAKAIDPLSHTIKNFILKVKNRTRLCRGETVYMKHAASMSTFRNVCFPFRRRWVDNIRMDLGEVGWGDVDWIVLAQDRNRWRALVNSVLNFRVP